jgi:hypothetical protein
MQEPGLVAHLLGEAPHLEAMSSTPQISIMALMHCSMKRSAFTTFSVRCPVMSWNEQAV